MNVGRFVKALGTVVNQSRCMKRFVHRLLTGLLPGGTKKHLIRIATVLGLPPEVLHSMRQLDLDRCEEAFLRAIRGKHGCTVDWRASPEDIREALAECMTSEEIALLRTVAIPNERTASRSLIKLGNALEGKPMSRSLVPLESFGDFAIVLLVPKLQREEIESLSNGWLIR